MNYSNRRKTAGEGDRRGLRVAVIAMIVGIVIISAVFAVSNWLGPFPFGISRRDTTLLTLWNEGNFGEVLLQAEVVLDEKPLDAQALTFGGFSYFYVGVDLAMPAEQQDYLRRSLLLLRKAEHVQRAPLEGERRYVMAKAYYHTGDQNYDVSASYMVQSIAAGYVADDTYSYLGLAYEGIGEHLLSAQAYETGLTLRDSTALRMKAAEARVATGEYEAAEAHLRAAIQENRDDFLGPVLGVELSAVLIAQEKLSEAEVLLLDLVEKHPDLADASYYLGVVFTMTGRSIEARDMWRRAREIDPDHLKALESLANSEE